MDNGETDISGEDREENGTGDGSEDEMAKRKTPTKKQTKKRYVLVRSHIKRVGGKKIKVRAHLRKK